MKTHPIIFSDPMVKAILEGRKTQTRRVMKPQPHGISPSHWYFHEPGNWWTCGDNTGTTWRCPYGVPGDHLWVRETWRKTEDRTGEPSHPEFEYQADYQGVRNTGKWRPSIFMPRLASRITLELVDVRVERVQYITETDAEAEGTIYSAHPNSPYGNGHIPQFHYLWDTINAKRGDGWSSNPMVWAYTFEVITP